MADAVELPIEADLVIYCGSTFRKAWRWTRGGQPGVTSEWSGAAQVRARPRADSPVLLTLSVTCEDDGTVRLYATDELTSAVEAASGVYDVEVENPAGERQRFAMGGVEFSPEVTR